MSDLAHQHLVHRLNRRAQQQEENARMDAMEKEWRPLMMSVMVGAAIIIALNLLTEHLDKHDTQEARPSGGVVRVAA